MITSQETVLVENGLSRPVRIVRDRFGLEHIYAESEADLFFGQGFNVARTRLWQIDLWRRRGLGLLGEVLGPGFVAQDRACRTFLYAGNFEVEWAHYPAGTRAACENFCAGINSFVGRITRGDAPLPREFKELGFSPSLWCPEDIVSVRNNTLTTNAVSELKRARLLQNGHAGTDKLRSILRPFDPDIRIAKRLENLDQLIATLTMATAPVIISRERLASPVADIEKWSDPILACGVAPINHTAQILEAVEGSNNWAIAPSKTSSGFPILANDPHRALQTPSLRYVVHLDCPSFSVIGAGEPALPGISIGHNATVAFGLTIFPADQEDVFYFEVGDEAADLTTKQEDIPVKNSAPHSILRRWFKGSPVLSFDETTGQGVAIRTVWSEPGASPYLGSLALLNVKSVAQFRAALKDWRLPAVNYVAADKTGSIGWFVAGAVPVRKSGFGLLPSTCNDDPWSGFLANEELPTKIDPPEGYVMSANEFNLPEEWDSSRKPVAFEWYEEFRARRIHDELQGETSATIEKSLALQDDVISYAARDLIGLLSKVVDKATLDKLPAIARQLLEWDGAIDNEAWEAIFFNGWVREFLKPAVLKYSDHSAPDSCIADMSTEATIAALDEIELGARRTLLLDSLTAAAAAFPTKRYRQRRALFRHAIQDGVFSGPSFSPPPGIWRGDDTTVHFGKSGNFQSVIEFGASFRMALDLANWDLSRWSNLPDQSKLADGSNAVPLLFSSTAVDQNTKSVTILSPVLRDGRA